MRSDRSLSRPSSRARASRTTVLTSVADEPLAPTRAVGLVAGGLAAGVLLGMLGYLSVARHHRRDLFDPHPARRFAALSFVRARPSPEAARALREYVAWETVPRLRQRGARALRRMETSLAG